MRLVWNRASKKVELLGESEAWAHAEDERLTLHSGAARKAGQMVLRCTAQACLRVGRKTGANGTQMVHKEGSLPRRF